MERLVQKTATILVCLRGRSRWYRSVEEMPQTLRKKLRETTSGPNAATLVIADENGRKEIMKLAAKASASLESRLVESMLGRKGRVRHWLEVGLVAGIGVCLYLLTAWR